MPSEKLYAQPKSVPAPAPICLVVSTHSEPVLKKPDGPVSGAGNFEPESVKSLTDASSTRVASRQPVPSAGAVGAPGRDRVRRRRRGLLPGQAGDVVGDRAVAVVAVARGVRLPGAGRIRHRPARPPVRSARRAGAGAAGRPRRTRAAGRAGARPWCRRSRSCRRGRPSPSSRRCRWSRRGHSCPRRPWFRRAARARRSRRARGAGRSACRRSRSFPPLRSSPRRPSCRPSRSFRGACRPPRRRAALPSLPPLPAPPSCPRRRSSSGRSRCSRKRRSRPARAAGEPG